MWTGPNNKCLRGWGYSHESSAYKNPYEHNRRAHKDSYPHDGNIQCFNLGYQLSFAMINVHLMISFYYLVMLDFATIMLLTDLFLFLFHGMFKIVKLSS